MLEKCEKYHISRWKNVINSTFFQYNVVLILIARGLMFYNISKNLHVSVNLPNFAA